MDTKFDQLERKIDSLEKKFESLESRVQKIEQFQDDLLAHLKVLVIEDFRMRKLRSNRVRSTPLSTYPYSSKSITDLKISPIRRYPNEQFSFYRRRNDAPPRLTGKTKNS
jgi:hypothetical protein